MIINKLLDKIGVRSEGDRLTHSAGDRSVVAAVDTGLSRASVLMG
jgi:hypothetical protein